MKIKNIFITLFLLFSLALPTLAEEKLEKFKTQEIQIGTLKMQAEVADTESKRSQGLMYRKQFKDGQGMLFIFDEAAVRSFWMKNTFVDLSIGFFNEKQELTEILDMKAVSSVMQTNLPTYTSKSPAKFALEVPQGWFQRQKVKLGSRLKLLKE